LIGRGERVLRVPTKLMADARRGGSKRGKSDRIDAIAVARAGLRERLDELPLAQLDGRELDLRLLVDHRQRLVGQRVRIQNTLQWHLHDLRPELTLPAAHCFRSSGAPGSRGVWPAPSRYARPDHPRRAPASARTDPGNQGARTRDRPTRRPGRTQLLAKPGFGPLTAAKLVGEIAGAQRFSSDANSPAPPAWHGSQSARATLSP
jgi:transposase